MIRQCETCTAPSSFTSSALLPSKPLLSLPCANLHCHRAETYTLRDPTGIPLTRPEQSTQDKLIPFSFQKRAPTTTTCTLKPKLGFCILLISQHNAGKTVEKSPERAKDSKHIAVCHKEMPFRPQRS